MAELHRLAKRRPPAGRRRCRVGAPGPRAGLHLAASSCVTSWRPTSVAGP